MRRLFQGKQNKAKPYNKKRIISEKAVRNKYIHSQLGSEESTHHFAQDKFFFSLTSLTPLNPPFLSGSGLSLSFSMNLLMDPSVSVDSLSPKFFWFSTISSRKFSIYIKATVYFLLRVKLEKMKLKSYKIDYLGR